MFCSYVVNLFKERGRMFDFLRVLNTGENTFENQEENLNV